jgi:hypothetical protein
VKANPALCWGLPALRARAARYSPDRPALGPADQVGHLGAGQLDPGPLQQCLAFPLVHGQLGGTDLHHLPLGAEQRHRQGRAAARGEHDLGPGGQPQGELGDPVQARPVLEGLHMVEDHGDRLGHGRDRGQ